MAWGVQLEGHQFDLLDWEEALRPPFDPWVDRVQHQAEMLFALRSTTFNGLSSAAEVIGHGRELVRRLNGALAVERNSEPLRVASVLEFPPGGGTLRHYFLEPTPDRIRVRGSAVGLVVTDANGNVKPPPAPSASLAQRWNAAAELNDGSDQLRAEITGDLLVHLGRCDNWFDIYKTIELAEALAGGEHALLKLAGNDGANLKRARTTANGYRHARGYLPSDAATLADARQAAFLAAKLVLV